MPLGLLAYLRNHFDDGMGDMNGGGGGAPTPTGGGQNPGQTAPPAPERTFTQTDIDKIIGDRLARERNGFNSQMQQYQQQMQQQFQPYMDFYNQYGQQMQGQPQGGQQQDPYADRWAQMDTMYEELMNSKVDAMEANLIKAHPEIAQTEGLLDQIYSFAAENGYQNLDHAYWALVGPQQASRFENEKKTLSENAIKEYLAKKQNPPATPEGAGGAPGAQVNVPHSFDEAMKAHKASMNANRQV